MQPTIDEQRHAALRLERAGYSTAWVNEGAGGFPERFVVPSISPVIDAPYATLLAANGPKMLAVARDHADGALPAVQPPAFTTLARDVLGVDKLLAVSVPVVADDDAGRARDTARTFLSAVLGLGGTSRTKSGGGSPYAAGLGWLGYSESALAEVPDDLLEDLVAFETPGDVAGIRGWPRGPPISPTVVSYQLPDDPNGQLDHVKPDPNRPTVAFVLGGVATLLHRSRLSPSVHPTAPPRRGDRGVFR